MRGNKGTPGDGFGGLAEQLKAGPKPGALVEAAAQEAAIAKRSLLAATDTLGVRCRRGEWRLPG